MPSWWPFGRKRRRQKELELQRERERAAAAAVVPPAPRAVGLQEKTPAPEPVRPSAPASVPRQQSPVTPTTATAFSARQSLDPFSDSHAHNYPPTSSAKALKVATSAESRPQRLSSSRVRGSAESLTALPQSAHAARKSPHLRPVPESHDALAEVPPSNFLSGLVRSATVRSKRSLADTEVSRQRSARRRRDDYQREQEVKAMSRPVSRSYPDGINLVRGNSTRDHGALGRNFTGFGSTTSLPRAESVRSSITCFSEQHRFDIGALAVLSPRPTIRYSLQPQYVAAPNAQIPSRSSSRREPRPVSRRSINDGKIIDDLADDLNAGTIRELMERDQKRRERRLQADEERARRRLERHAAYAAKNEAASPSDRKGKQVVRTTPDQKLSVDPTSVTVVPRPRDSEYHQPIVLDMPKEVPTQDPFADPVEFEDAITRMQGDGRRTNLDLIMPATPRRDELPPPVSPPRPPSEAKTPVSTSDSSSRNLRDLRQGSIVVKSEAEMLKRRGGTFSTLFGRQSPGRKGSADQVVERGMERGKTPSAPSFSNTSRDSMSRQPIPAHLVGESVSVPSRPKSKSSLPVRTMSRFREDLPESPIAAAEVSGPTAEGETLDSITEKHEPSNLEMAQVAPERPALHIEPVVAVSEKPTEIGAHNLAPVDSEAAWISPRRRNSQLVPGETLLSGGGGESGEKLVPGEKTATTTTMPRRQLSGIRAALADSDEDSDEELSAAMPAQEVVRRGEIARVPTVVHRQPRVVSEEGALNVATQNVAEPATPATLGSNPSESEPGSPVEFGISQPALGKYVVQHARQVSSSGSAVLLDIPARTASISRISTPSRTPPPQQERVV